MCSRRGIARLALSPVINLGNPHGLVSSSPYLTLSQPFLHPHSPTMLIVSRRLITSFGALCFRPLITRSVHDLRRVQNEWQWKRTTDDTPRRSPKESRANRLSDEDSPRHSFRSPAFRGRWPYRRDSGPRSSTKDRLGDKRGQDKDGASTECGDVEGHDITQRDGWGQRAELSREREAPSTTSKQRWTRSGTPTGGSRASRNV